MTSRMLLELLGFRLSTNAKVKKMTTVSAVIFEIVEMYIFQIHLHFFLACCMLKENRDLFYFEFVPEFIHWSLLWKDISCFRRLILSLIWKSNDRGGLKFWTCLHATVLLTVKYSAELNKYILLVRVICEKYRFRGQSNVPRR
jgi:hypothetical protein